MQSKSFTASTLYSAIKQTAESRGLATALVHENRVTTYAELIRQVDLVASYLHDLGLRQGETISAFSQNCPEFAIYFYAAAKLGLVFVPLNFNLTETEIAYILRHCEAKYLFWDEAAASTMKVDVSGVGFKPLQIPEVTLATAECPCDSRINPDSDLVIAYTSGSTGNPKAVAISHRSTLKAALSLIELWDLSDKDTTIVAAPLGFLLGLSTATTVGLLAGMKVVIHRRFHPAEVLEAFIKHKATVYNGVPTMYSMMLEYSEQQDKSFDLSGMRAIISSGAPMPDELLKRFASKFGKSLQNYYGMTECYPLIGKYAADPLPLAHGAVGKIVPGALIYAINPDGKACAPLQEGEFLVKAPSMMTRYHKDPVLTQSVFQDGWFKTGDLGYIDEQGYVYITGRIKDVIIKGGANISPLEVENTLMIHPDVASVAVIGVPDKIYGETPIAYVVKRPGSILDQQTVVAHATTHLAKFKIPSAIIFCLELPVGKTGKVDKNALRKEWDKSHQATA
ncbi:class I adenylate-forming enzyme family protein [Pseudomonas sp. H11T01]|uniref:class I adenylate-forming enzyme family protein n=1 Tax=Pseudomonas sp. H11T01 TaxID=3402749 RepID=UPI003ABF9CF7